MDNKVTIWYTPRMMREVTQGNDTRMNKEEELEQAKEAGKVLSAIVRARYRTNTDLAAAIKPPMEKQQLNKLLKGQTARPSMYDLTRIGQAVGLTPNQVAAIYGYWTPGAEDELLTDMRMHAIQTLLLRLDEEERDRVLNWVEVEVRRLFQEAVIKRARKKRG